MTYDSPEAIIEAVREWQEATTMECFCDGYSEDGCLCGAQEAATNAIDALLALRLPPKGEGR